MLAKRRRRSKRRGHVSNGTRPICSAFCSVAFRFELESRDRGRATPRYFLKKALFVPEILAFGDIRFFYRARIGSRDRGRKRTIERMNRPDDDGQFPNFRSTNAFLLDFSVFGRPACRRSIVGLIVTRRYKLRVTRRRGS